MYLNRVFTLLLIFAGFFNSRGQDIFEAERGRVWVDSVSQGLTLEEKVSQLIFIRAAHYSDSVKADSLRQLIKDLRPGGLTFFAGTPHDQVLTINQLQAASKVPMLISIDAEWGLAMRLDSTIQFPYAMALGAVGDNDLIFQMGKEIARECRRMGIHMNFAPVADVNINPKNPVINYRSFGESPQAVAMKAVSYALGLQAGGVLPTAKHFPGHGDTETDSHLELPQLNFDRERLDSVELYPFRKLIEKGVSGIMTAHLSIPGMTDGKDLPATLSSSIITGLLRDELNFHGLLVTDALEMKGITRYFKDGAAAVESFKAGNDIILLPGDVEEARRELLAAFRSGILSVEDLDRRLKKVLFLKFQMGLDKYTPVKMENLTEELNSTEAMLLNRKLVESSLTLIRDENGLIPSMNLQENTFASISVGRDPTSIFQERLDDYTKVDHFNLGRNATDEDVDDLLKQLVKYDRLIVGLHDRFKRPLNQVIYSEPVFRFLKSLDSNKTIWVSFRNPYTLSELPFEQLKTVITTYFDSELTEDLAAQAVFGGIGLQGHLPVSVGASEAGDGIGTKGGTRLKYTIPEELGIRSDSLTSRIDRIVSLGLDSAAYPGAQVLIAKDGKVFYHKTYGYHTYDKIRQVKKDDIYDFASVTKITGPLPGLMLLHDQGKFSLDATLSDYVPEMRWSNKKNLRWRNILSHHARLKAWIPYWTTAIRKNGKYKRNTLTTVPDDDYPIELKGGLYLHKDYKKKIYRMIKKSPLNEKGGFLYSGLSFYLYPRLIEEKTGERYEDFLKGNIYKKIGAHSLTYNPSRFYDLDRLVPTERDTFFRKMQIHGVVHDEGAAMMDGVSGNAGLFGTANDLAKLMQMYLNMGSFGGEQIISFQTLRKFTGCQYCEEGNHRGLGFDKPLLENRENGTPAPSASYSSFGHSGYTGTFTWADPETGILFVFFSNRVYPTRLNRKLYTLNIRPQIHQVVYDMLNIR